jgi:hypothetical protein
MPSTSREKDHRMVTVCGVVGALVPHAFVAATCTV